MPVVMEDYVDKAKKRAERERQEYLRQHKQREGKISIDYVPPVEKKINKDEGDYIDYEEVKVTACFLIHVPLFAEVLNGYIFQ